MEITLKITLSQTDESNHPGWAAITADQRAVLVRHLRMQEIDTDLLASALDLNALPVAIERAVATLSEQP